MLDEAATRETPAAQPAKPAVEEAPAPETPVDTPKPHLIKTSQDTQLVDENVVIKELGASTGLGLFGGNANYDGMTVQDVSIRYISGKRTVPDQRLLDVIQTAKGTKYSTTRINDDLERLLKKGLVDSNARVSVTPQGRGVKVVFEVQPAMVMGGVGFTGNRNFSDKKLREATKLLSSKVINDRDLAMARAEIIRLYQKDGYPDVKVTWRHTKTAREGYNDVIFDIQEGREVRMQRIRFVGNRQFDSQQLRQIMKTKERDIFFWINDSGNVDRERLDEDMQVTVVAVVAQLRLPARQDRKGGVHG